VTGEEIINSARVNYLDDAYNVDYPEDNLWSQEELIEYLVEAENEAAERAELLHDTTTPNMCLFSSFSTGSLILDPRIIYVQNAYWNGRQLEEVARDQIDTGNPGWRSMTGTPEFWFIDKGKRLFLFRAPADSGELVLEACRRPKNLLDIDRYENASPAIATHLHSHLAHWIAYRAYLKQDTETADPQKAKRHLDIFETRFGPPKSSRDLVDRGVTARKRVNFANIMVS